MESEKLKGKLLIIQSSSQDLEQNHQGLPSGNLNPKSENNHLGDQKDHEKELSEMEIEKLIRQSMAKKQRQSASYLNQKQQNESLTTKKNVEMNSKQRDVFDQKEEEGQEDWEKKFDQYNFSYPNVDEEPRQYNDQISSRKSMVGCRNHVLSSILAEKQKQLNISNVTVHFPFEPYQPQINYMKGVIKSISQKKNALLESPTGTGKTLCLLCSAMSWVQKSYQERRQKVKIIYLSRTHSQLKQVQQELEKTCYRPTIINFGSRDQFCIKKEFQQLKGRDLMQNCSKAVKRTVKIKRKLELDPQENGADDHICNFYKNQTEYKNILQHKQFEKKIITSDLIKEEGKRHGFCPYYYPFMVKEKADLIFMPYNYILDVGLFSRYSDIIKDSILIFDESHNVGEAACEGRSYALTHKTFDNVLQQIEKLNKNRSMSIDLLQIAEEFSSVRTQIHMMTSSAKERLQRLVESIFDRQKKLAQYDSHVEKILQPKEIKLLFYYLLHPNEISYQKLNQMRGNELRDIHMETACRLIQATKQADDLVEALKETYDGVFQQLEKFNSFLLKVVDLLGCSHQEMQNEKWWEQEINHYRILIKATWKQTMPYDLNLVCLTPSLTFANLIKLKPRSIILTSGTLAPLNSWRKELRIPFEVQLVNNHVIKKEQLHMAIVKQTLTVGSSMNFSFSSIQKKPTIFSQLVQTILVLVPKIPNGVLIIFPSYRVISSFKDELKNDPKSLNQLRKAKDICFEDKGTADFIIKNFRSKAATPKGAVLFCVCRGKLSQGLDFSDELCRAVIFVGVPYPSIKDAMLMEKREYYDKLSNTCKEMEHLTGEEWYKLNTMRAVNQGLGRVIRHIDDFGMIFLMDERYEQGKILTMLPEWSKKNMGIYQNFNGVIQKAKQFFRERKVSRKNSILRQEDRFSFQKNEKEDQQLEKPLKNAFQILMKPKNRKMSTNKKNQPSPSIIGNKVIRFDNR